MAISSINGTLGGVGSSNSLQLLTAIRAAQSSQTGVENLTSSSLGALGGGDLSSTLDRLVQYSGNSTLTLILADQERKKKEGTVTDALFALINYQATKDFFDNSAANLASQVLPVGFTAQA